MPSAQPGPRALAQMGSPGSTAKTGALTEVAPASGATRRPALVKGAHSLQTQDQSNAKAQRAAERQAGSAVHEPRLSGDTKGPERALWDPRGPRRPRALGAFQRARVNVGAPARAQQARRRGPCFTSSHVTLSSVSTRPLAGRTQRRQPSAKWENRAPDLGWAGRHSPAVGTEEPALGCTPTPLLAGARHSHATPSESAVRSRFCLICSGWGPPSSSARSGRGSCAPWLPAAVHSTPSPAAPTPRLCSSSQHDSCTHGPPPLLLGHSLGAVTPGVASLLGSRLPQSPSLSPGLVAAPHALSAIDGQAGRLAAPAPTPGPTASPLRLPGLRSPALSLPSTSPRTGSGHLAPALLPTRVQHGAGAQCGDEPSPTLQAGGLLPPQTEAEPLELSGRHGLSAALSGHRSPPFRTQQVQV